MEVATDFYQVLGIRKNAKQSTIKRAYRRLALIHHPDKGGDPEQFKRITEAYTVLSNETKRAKYDAGEDYTVDVADLATKKIKNAFLEIIEMGRDADSVEIITAIICNEKSRQERTIQQLKAYYERNHNLIDKVKPKHDQPNIFNDVINDTLIQISRQMKAAGHEIAICDEAAKIISGYYYKKEAVTARYLTGKSAASYNIFMESMEMVRKGDK